MCEEPRVSKRVSLQVANDAPFMVYLAFRGKSVSPWKIHWIFLTNNLKVMCPQETVFRLSSLEARYKNLSVIGCTQFLWSTCSLNEISKRMAWRFLNVILFKLYVIVMSETIVASKCGLLLCRWACLWWKIQCSNIHVFHPIAVRLLSRTHSPWRCERNVDREMISICLLGWWIS